MFITGPTLETAFFCVHSLYSIGVETYVFDCFSFVCVYKPKMVRGKLQLHKAKN